MKTIIFSKKGIVHLLALKISTYPGGNLAIKLLEKEHDQFLFWDNLTVNSNGIRPLNCAFINVKNPDLQFPAWLERNQLAEPTGQVCPIEGISYPEYRFHAKKLAELDNEGYIHYTRCQKGELGVRFKRLYLALGRLSREIKEFRYADYSDWRCLEGSTSTLPLWIEAEDPTHGRRFHFIQKGPVLQTTIFFADGTEKSVLYRRKEDMASDLLSLFQEELRVYKPWSDERRQKYWQ